ncbi:MAG: diacylglycerol kinase family lipid kinase [Deltaproteobacteria bacterium]|nr:diacylglycerol kinase family lipid kinase [Deltaproteobacteria bacterium]
MRTVLVVNPKSANGATGRHFAQIARAVRAAIGDFEHEFTTAPLEATALTRRALARGAQCVVAVGGDGTTNEVVNGFFDEQGRPLAQAAALGIVPRGTGGDFRKAFGWSADLAQAAARLKGEACRIIDVGRIRFVDARGAPAARLFVNIASAGVSGLVDFEVNRASKVLGGKVSFALGTLKAMLRYRDVPVRATFDGGPVETFPATVVAVANGQFFGGGMWIAPGARPDDGTFDVTIWSGYGLGDFVTRGKAIYDGSHVRFPNTRTLKARRVTLEADAPVLLDVDGEQLGQLPATIELLPGALRLKVGEAEPTAPSSQAAL